MIKLWGLPWWVQWLGLHAYTAVAPGSIPRWGIKILQTATWPQKKLIDLRKEEINGIKYIKMD